MRAGFDLVYLFILYLFISSLTSRPDQWPLRWPLVIRFTDQWPLLQLWLDLLSKKTSILVKLTNHNGTVLSEIGKKKAKTHRCVAHECIGLPVNREGPRTHTALSKPRFIKHMIMKRHYRHDWGGVAMICMEVAKIGQAVYTSTSPTPPKPLRLYLSASIQPSQGSQASKWRRE